MTLCMHAMTVTIYFAGATPQQLRRQGDSELATRRHSSALVLQCSEQTAGGAKSWF